MFGGYDWWIGPEWSLGLHAEVTGTTSSRMRTDDDDTGYDFHAFSLGIGYAITHH